MQAGSSNGSPRTPWSASGGREGGGARVFEYTLRSDFNETRPAADQIMQAVTEFQYSENDIFAIRLCLEEALINAVKHGNKHDPAKSVRVTARVSADDIEIVIQDQGPGFRREDVPDPTLAENLEKFSGRGILLIEAYMTNVEWSDAGRRIRLYKKREAVAQPA
jgi:serine/threonine-protein kinase RsbW